MTLRARWLGRVPYHEGEQLQRWLHSRAADDYLLPVGHPALITAASIVIGMHAQARASLLTAGMADVRARALPHVGVLVWQGKPTGYAPVRLPLFAPPENQSKPVNPQSPEKNP